MLGFTITGILSTLFMLGIYVLLNKVIRYQLSYLIAYVLSVVALYFMNVVFVFKKKPSVQTFLQFPLIYLFQYAVGAIALEFLVRLGFSVDFSPVLVIIILFPLTFVLNKWVIA